MRVLNKKSKQGGHRSMKKKVLGLFSVFESSIDDYADNGVCSRR